MLHWIVQSLPDSILLYHSFPQRFHPDLNLELAHYKSSLMLAHLQPNFLNGPNFNPNFIINPLPNPLPKIIKFLSKFNVVIERQRTALQFVAVVQRNKIQMR